MALAEMIIAVLVLAVFFLLYKNLEWKFRFEKKIREWKDAEERMIRDDAISRSARTVSGKTLEKLVPFLDKFYYDPHDVRWLGDPVDLVIFDGYSKNGEPKQIVFCEVKSGNSKLSKIQNKIKSLIENKKVLWYEFRL